jgi:hypothetical protein
MLEVITYSLRDGYRRSDSFYREVAALTDKVLAEAKGCAQPLIEAFRAHLQQAGNESPRSDSEYVLELLTLGVLWRVYAGDALGLARVPQRALAYLVRLHQRGGRLKPAFDFLRGVLGRLFLSSDGDHPMETAPPTLEHLDRLLDWLSATDTFTQEVKRLRAWRDFLASLPPEQAQHNLETALTFAAWFEVYSETILGRYTPHVERFLAETHPNYRWREDAVFCGRRRVEYHLNMVGAEILNRAFRDAFLGAARKVVLAPPCMQAQPEGVCQAHSTPFGARCAGCTPGCRIHQLTKLGEKHGFEVLIMPHELSVFSSGAVEPVENGAVGVVGISCVLTNPSGGWETRDLGIPAQGVLLDYCGCPWHWHEKGIPTDINVRQLLKVLGTGDPKDLGRTVVRTPLGSNSSEAGRKKKWNARIYFHRKRVRVRRRYTTRSFASVSSIQRRAERLEAHASRIVISSDQ